MFEQTIQPATQAQLERIGRLVQERQDAWAIPRVSGEFLHALVLAGGYRRGLEIGTSYGYSGLWLGAALRHNGGSLLTVEVNPAKVEFARQVFGAAELAETITVVPGVALETLAELPGPFDFVFIDADKENTRRYFELVWPKLAHRATIVTDNLTSHEAELREYAAYLRGHPQLCSVLVPIGSGLEVTVKLDPYATTATVDGADWVI